MSKRESVDRVAREADENIPDRTVNLLKGKGVNISSILEFGRGLNDDAVLRFANEQDRILVTFDKDFGNLVFTMKENTNEVILRRVEIPRTRG